MNKILHNVPLTQIPETINPNHSRQLSQQNSISFIHPRHPPSIWCMYESVSAHILHPHGSNQLTFADETLAINLSASGTIRPGGN